MTRDYGPLFLAGQACRCCGLVTLEHEAHAALHLASGEAVVWLVYDCAPPREEVRVTGSIPTYGEGGSIWDASTSGDPEYQDSNSVALRRAHTELAATRRRIARAAKENG